MPRRIIEGQSQGHAGVATTPLGIQVPEQQGGGGGLTLEQFSGFAQMLVSMVSQRQQIAVVDWALPFQLKSPVVGSDSQGRRTLQPGGGSNALLQLDIDVDGGLVYGYTPRPEVGQDVLLPLDPDVGGIYTITRWESTEVWTLTEKQWMQPFNASVPIEVHVKHGASFGGRAFRWWQNNRIGNDAVLFELVDAGLAPYPRLGEPLIGGMGIATEYGWNGGSLQLGRLNLISMRNASGPRAFELLTTNQKAALPCLEGSRFAIKVCEYYGGDVTIIVPPTQQIEHPQDLTETPSVTMALNPGAFVEWTLARELPGDSGGVQPAVWWWRVTGYYGGSVQQANA